MSRIQARCEGLLSILKSNRQVFNFSKYGQAFANAIISVVQTGVTLSAIFKKSLKSEHIVTPVCTTEIIAFTKAHTYFSKINTELLGLSVDSNASHLAWIYDIYCRTGIKISFPIIADRNGEIARKYGMISSDVSNTETVRNVYVIDDKGIIRTILIYPMNVGRFIPEIIRIVQALQMSDCANGSTAANWVPLLYQ